MAEAELLRHQQGLGNGHVDLAALAEALLVDLVRVPWDGVPVEGKYVRRAGRSFILVNTARPGSRQRFTLAHELGHHCLAGDEADLDFTDDLSAFRSKVAEERQANQFASALLMDARGVAGAVDGLPWDDAVAAVAREFDVSIEAAAIRLSELGLLDGPTVTTFLEDLKSRAWRRSFKVDHGLPVGEGASSDRVDLPARFVEKVVRLQDAGLVSEARVRELLDRPRDVRVANP